MNSSLDLNLLLLAQQALGVTDELPDLYAVTPPRRTARGRESDSLIIYLSLVGNSPLSPHAHGQLLEQLAHKFYKTTGSLTAALRTIAEALNLYLLDRNLRSTSVGRQGIGQLLLVALRADTLYMAQSGPVQAYLVTQTVTQRLYDVQTSGRGLGLSRALPIRFVQVKMKPDDYLILATVPSPGWTDTILKHPSDQGIESLRRQLMDSTSQEFNSVIIQALAGTGKLRILRRKAEAPDTVAESMADQPKPVSTAIPAPVEIIDNPDEDQRPGLPPVSVPDLSAPVELIEDKELGAPASPALPTPQEVKETLLQGDEQPQAIPATSQAAYQPPTSKEAETPSAVLPPTTPVKIMEPSSKPILEPAQPPIVPLPAKPRPWSKYLTPWLTTLVSIGSAILRAVRSALSTIGGALLRLMKSLLPDADVLRMPPSMMVFIAIAIPVILAVIGGVVFLQRGRAQQQQVYYLQAVKEADYAATLTDPLEQRTAWKTTLGKLDKADNYSITSQSEALRAEVTTKLDTLDAVKRLDYKQAIVNGLDAEVSVTHIIATTADLYLLNGKEGNVLHAVLTARGYEVDPNFQCGPTQGPINVGPLVDIIELAPGAYENASVLGMDSSGNLLFCVIGGQPYSASMVPPNTGLGEPVAMSLDRGDLYVLAPSVNAVWIYRNMEVSQQPRLFFGDTVPPMQDVIDLAVYNDDLFLLHTDGHITKCTYSGMAESPTRCDDPYPYSDNRPGRTHGPTIQDAIFDQIYFSSFTERSIFLFEPQNQAIYYFSVLLTLQWQYQPKFPLVEGNATAFAISPNRTAFLAIGNHVYYAAMP